MKLLMANVLSIICILIAGVLVYCDRSPSQWGWFFALGVFAMHFNIVKDV
jgi:hypothetical protein